MWIFLKHYRFGIKWVYFYAILFELDACLSYELPQINHPIHFLKVEVVVKANEFLLETNAAFYTVLLFSSKKEMKDSICALLAKLFSFETGEE